MTAAGGNEAPAAAGQGFRYEGDDPQALAEALDAAFDYRGDVTLLLRDGSRLEGYLSNRRLGGRDPFVELFLASEPRPRRVPLGDVRGVALTGRDTASGKSWETWVKKYRAKKEAEARGERVEAVGLFPDPLT